MATAAAPPRRNSDVAQGVHAIARNLAREFGAAFDLSEGFSWQRGGPDAAVPRDPDKPHYHPVLRFGLEAPGAMARSELDGRLGHVDVGPGNALRSAEAIAVCPRVADAADVEHERLRAALCVPQTGEAAGPAGRVHAAAVQCRVRGRTRAAVRLHPQRPPQAPGWSASTANGGSLGIRTCRRTRPMSKG